MKIPEPSSDVGAVLAKTAEAATKNAEAAVQVMRLIKDCELRGVTICHVEVATLKTLLDHGSIMADGLLFLLESKFPANDTQK